LAFMPSGLFSTEHQMFTSIFRQLAVRYENWQLCLKSTTFKTKLVFKQYFSKKTANTCQALINKMFRQNTVANR